jgi:hypothetical protein
MAKKLFLLLPAAALSLFMFSCGGAKQESTVDNDREETKDTIKQEITADLAVLRSKIPAPAEMGKTFTGAGLNYNRGALLSSGKASSYSSRYQQALGLGAFSADLGFTCAFNQSQDAMEYLAAMGKLAQALGVQSAFDQNFGARIIKNISNSDSLDKLMSAANDKAERNMRSNQRVQSAVLMMFGNWVENLFVAAEHVKSKRDDPKSTPVYKEIYATAQSWEYIKDLLEQYKGTADIDKFGEDIKPFLPVINAVGNHPEFSSKLPDGLFDKFYEAITGLRNKVL